MKLTIQIPLLKKLSEQLIPRNPNLKHLIGSDGVTIYSLCK